MHDERVYSSLSSVVVSDPVYVNDASYSDTKLLNAPTDSLGVAKSGDPGTVSSVSAVGREGVWGGIAGHTFFE